LNFKCLFSILNPKDGELCAKKIRIFNPIGGDSMTSAIDGTGGGTGEVTGAELDLLEEGKIKFAGASSKLTDAYTQVDEATIRLDAFQDLVLYNYGGISGLRTELNKAKAELQRVREEREAIEKIVRAIGLNVNSAERQLGKGSDALRVYLDKIGNLQGEQPATELMESLEASRTTLSIKLDELKAHLNGVTGDLGFGDAYDLAQVTTKNENGRIITSFSSLILPSESSVTVGSFIDRKLQIEKEVGNIDTEESLLFAIDNALKYGGITVDEDSTFSTALKEVQKIPPRGRPERAEGLTRKAIRESNWGSLSTSGTALGYMSEATQQLNTALGHVSTARESFNMEDGTGLTAFSASINDVWAEKVALGLFRLRQEEDVNAQTAFKKDNGEYVLRPAYADEDFISQGGYVELVNILHSVEDAIGNKGLGTLFSKDEREAFWGMTELKTFQVISPDGAPVSVTQRIRLSTEDRAAAKDANLSTWEGEEHLKNATEGLIIDEMSDSDFMMLSRRIINSNRQLRVLSQGSSLSPGLRAQARWAADLGGIVKEGYNELNRLRKMGKDKPVTLDSGLETTTGMIVLRKAFKTWQGVGGLTHLSHLKKAVTQINLGDAPASVIIRPSTQDLLFFEYASTGEAALNRQIGSLGETMELLNDYLDNLNNIDGVMSKPTLQVNHKGLLESSASFTVEADGVRVVNAFNGLFELLKKKSDVIGSAVSAGDRIYKTSSGEVGQLNSAQRAEIAKLLARAKLRLQGLDGDAETKRPLEELEQGGLGEKESDEAFQARATVKKENVEAVFKDFAGVGISTSGPGALSGFDLDEVNKQMHYLNITIGSLAAKDQSFFEYINYEGVTAESETSQVARLIRSDIHHLFNDEGFTQHISTAITHGQGVNDTLKQNLKKTMFVYQEFIKSAGTVMDKIAEIVKGMASRIR
jgi:hypothetical protein